MASTRKCAKGFIKRAAFVRYTKKGKRTYVAEQCVPGIGPLRKGELAKYGYTRVANMSVSERHKALDKAVAEFGSLTTWRKLNAIAVYTKRTAPGSSRVFKEDMEYIRSKYGVKKGN